MKTINNLFSFLFLFFVWSCTLLTTSIPPSNNYCMAVDKPIHLKESFHVKDEHGYVLNPRNELVKSVNVLYKGIEYTLGISNSQTIEYISTSDKNFSINGFKVGDEINKTNTILGWGNYARINEEWYAAWMPMNNQVNAKMGIIQWFFMYDFE